MLAFALVAFSILILGTLALAWLGRTSTTTRRARVRLGVLALEDRTLPATVTLLPTVSVGDWYDPGIWDISQVPQMGDTVILANNQNAVITYDSINRPPQYTGPEYTAVANLLMTETLNVIGTLTVTGDTFLFDPLNPQFGSGTLNVALENDNMTTNRFTLGVGQELKGSGTFIIAEEGTWTGGKMSGTGQTVVGGGADLTLSGTDTKTLDTRTLTIQDGFLFPGEVRWVGGTIDLANNATIQNSGNFISEPEPGTPMNGLGMTGTGKIENLGTFTVLRTDDGTTTALAPNVTFVNRSDATQNGALILKDGKPLSPVTLNIQGTLKMEQIGGAGTPSAKFNTYSTLTVNNFAMDAGRVELAAAGKDETFLKVTGTMEWKAGTVAIEKALIDDGATFNLSGSSTKFVNHCKFVNSGTVNWNDGNLSILNADSKFFNLGFFEVKCDKMLTGLGTFINLGGFKKSVGAAGLATIIDHVTFQNGNNTETDPELGVFRGADSFEVAQGTVRFFECDSYHLNGFTTAAGTKVEFTSDLFARAHIFKPINAQHNPTYSLGEATIVVSLNSTLSMLDRVILLANKVVMDDSTSEILGGKQMQITQLNWLAGEIVRNNAFPQFDVYMTGDTKIEGDDGKAAVNGVVLHFGGTTTWKGHGDITLKDGVNVNITGDFKIENAQKIIKGGQQSQITILTGGKLRKLAGEPTTIEVDHKVDGGKIEIAPGLRIDFTSKCEMDSGEIILDSGTLASVLLVDIRGGALCGTGVIEGSLKMGGVLQIGGVGAVGSLQVTDNYEQAAGGVMEVEIAGLAPSQFDRLIVGENAVLAGALSVIPLGFTPPTGSTFDFLTTQSGLVSGSFGPVAGYDTIYGPNYVRLEKI